jgi:hypothetical protein
MQTELYWLYVDILEEYNIRGWTGFFWLRIEASVLMNTVMNYRVP